MPTDSPRSHRAGGPAERAAYWLAVSGGAGLSPVWPGTVGSVVGVALAGCLTLLGPLLAALILAGLFAAGTWASGVVEKRSGVEDPQFVVVDETFGTAATLIFLPPEPLWWIAGFLAFRLLDVAKPWPAGLVHRRMTGGLAIMLDDAIAAGYAAALLVVAAIVFD